MGLSLCLVSSPPGPGLCIPSHPHILERGLAHSRRSINVCGSHGSQKLGGYHHLLSTEEEIEAQKTSREPRLQSMSVARVRVAP